MDSNNELLRSQIFQYGGYPIPPNIYDDKEKLKVYIQLFKKDRKPPKKISPKKAVVKKAPIKKIKIENNSKQEVIVKQTKEKGNNIKITIDNRKQVKTLAIGAEAPQKTPNIIFSPYQTLGGIINNSLQEKLQEKLKDKNEIIQTQKAELDKFKIEPILQDALNNSFQSQPHNI